MVSLGQVGIEIIFASENAFAVNLAVERKRDSDGQLHRFFIEHGKRTWLTRANCTNITIRFCSDGIYNFASAKHFGLCEQLRVDFESDDRFIFHVCSDSLSHRERARVREKLIIPARRMLHVPIRLALIHVTDT